MSPGTDHDRTVRPDNASRIVTPAVKPPPTATNRPSGDHETAAFGVQTSPYSGSIFETSETVSGGAVAIPKGSTEAVARANPRTSERKRSRTTIPISERTAYRVPPPSGFIGVPSGWDIKGFLEHFVSMRRREGGRYRAMAFVPIVGGGTASRDAFVNASTTC